MVFYLLQLSTQNNHKTVHVAWMMGRCTRHANAVNPSTGANKNVLRIRIAKVM